MRRNYSNIVDEMVLSRIKSEPSFAYEPSPAQWIRILRHQLRMPQEELAKRSNISQPHLAAIELGKIDPQLSTLKRIFQGLGCELVFTPRPARPIQEMLRGRAKSVALKRLKQAMGTMALESQAPDKEVFRRLLEKRTDEILRDERNSLTHDK